MLDFQGVGESGHHARALPSRPAAPTDPGLQRIRSPLSRVAYGLPKGAAHLLVLEYGRVHLALKDGARMPDHDGPRLLWWVGSAPRELVVGAGTRGSLLTVPEAALMQALPTTPIGEQMQRTLTQDLDLAVESFGNIPTCWTVSPRNGRAEIPGPRSPPRITCR